MRCVGQIRCEPKPNASSASLDHGPKPLGLRAYGLGFLQSPLHSQKKIRCIPENRNPLASRSFGAAYNAAPSPPWPAKDRKIQELETFVMLFLDWRFNQVR